MAEESADYSPQKVEPKWQQYWINNKIFKFEANSPKPVFSIDNPPRYTSGPLHMGHAIGYSLIDIVSRYKRMRGYNVFLPLCFDGNGMPIEVKVEKEFSVNKNNTDRDTLVKMCSDYSNSNIKEMKEQFIKLGIMMDESLYYQTDSPEYRKFTQITFLKLYEKGLVYRKEHPVIWCPHCETSLSAADVEYHDESKELYYIKFSGYDAELAIATTRPELLSTCQLVAVHPGDERYKNAIGKKLKVPLFGREVQVIADDKVDPNFGTGAVMICTFGDKTDLYWAYKYNLIFIKGIDEKGKLTEAAGKYAGLYIKEGRKEVVKDLEHENYIIGHKAINQSVGTCWRCHTPVEFINKTNWFLKTLDFKQTIKGFNEKIVWHPDYMSKRLESWVDSLLWDWCISRQRYFATPIPVWACNKCDFVLPAKEEDCYINPLKKEPYIKKCPVCGGDMVGSDEVFDTWMDSSITPLYNTYWKRDDALFKKLYPMNLRPQSHDIIRTWVFYTLLRSIQITNEVPWKEIMIHGFIMAPDGTPMHASAGNAIDPLPIISEYGADAWRYYTSKCKLGEDTAFQIKDVHHGRKFANKYFNIMKFISLMVNSNGSSIDFVDESKMPLADRWILSRYSSVFGEVTNFYDSYQFDKAIASIENFTWHEFADFYIEMAKKRAKMGDKNALYTLYTIGFGVTQMLAPIMPHVTEEAFQEIFRKVYAFDSIGVTLWKGYSFFDEKALNKGEIVKKIVSSVREFSGEKRVHRFKKIILVGDMDQEVREEILGLKHVLLCDNIEIKNAVQTQQLLVGIKLKMDIIGKEYRNKAMKIVSLVSSMPIEDIYRDLKQNGYLELQLDNDTIKLPMDYFNIQLVNSIDSDKVEKVNSSVKDISIYASY